MPDTLKKQTITGVFWSGLERFSVQGVTFLVQLVLARLLTPNEYGLIGMLVVFLQIGQVFIDSGFANALIQKKECTPADFATVFYYNLLLSLAIYAILFFTAPFIASFYNQDILIPLLRLLSLTLIINALAIVQKTILVKRVDFRTQTKVSLFSAILSGIIGISLASKSFGVWALCWQQISFSFLQLFFYTLYVHWLPNSKFSKESFIKLFNFGSKLLISSLISVIYKNLYSVVIGKKFTAAELGYYTRAEQFAMFPSNNLGNIIARVAFPIFSKIQDDTPKLCTAYRRIIQYSSYIIFPLMCGLIAIAEPLITVLLTEKWLGIVPLLQILCIDWMLDHLSIINLNLLYVKGRSDWALRLEIIKKIIAIIILIATIPFGLTIMCWGRVLYSTIATIINTHYTRILINLNFFQQMIDIIPYLIGALVMAAIVYGVNLLISTSISQVIIGMLIGVITYAIITFICYKGIRMRLICYIKNRKRE